MTRATVGSLVLDSSPKTVSYLRKASATIFLTSPIRKCWLWKYHWAICQACWRLSIKFLRICFFTSSNLFFARYLAGRHLLSDLIWYYWTRKPREKHQKWKDKLSVCFLRLSVLESLLYFAINMLSIDKNEGSNDHNNDLLYNSLTLPLLMNLQQRL